VRTTRRVNVTREGTELCGISDLIIFDEQLLWNAEMCQKR